MDAETAKFMMTEHINDFCELIKKNVCQQQHDEDRETNNQPDERLKREATIATIKQGISKTDTERPVMTPAHMFHANIKSIHTSRIDGLKKCRETEVFERCNRPEAITA